MAKKHEFTRRQDHFGEGNKQGVVTARDGDSDQYEKPRSIGPEPRKMADRSSLRRRSSSGRR